MSEESAVKRFVAALGKLASLPESRIEKHFESVSDDELEHHQSVVEDVVGKADQVVGVKDDDPPPPSA